MLGSGSLCKVVVVVTMCADNAFVANFHLAGLAVHGADPRVGRTQERLADLWDAITSGVPQVGQGNNFVGCKLTPALVDGDTQVTDELSTFGAIRGGLLCFLVRALLAQCRDTPVHFLEKIVHHYLPVDVECIGICLEIIVGNFRLIVTVGTYHDCTIVAIECAERAEAGNTK